VTRAAARSKTMLMAMSPWVRIPYPPEQAAAGRGRFRGAEAIKGRPGEAKER
jgi:hypothetical protein